ncbi:MAG: hypothetical protein KDE59_19200 [Anaerolineales bacterium]|nr:hypothetical protein [Anaerolineales bacterium]
MNEDLDPDIRHNWCRDLLRDSLIEKSFSPDALIRLRVELSDSLERIVGVPLDDANQFIFLRRENPELTYMDSGHGYVMGDLLGPDGTTWLTYFLFWPLPGSTTPYALSDLKPLAENVAQRFGWTAQIEGLGLAERYGPGATGAPPLELPDLSIPVKWGKWWAATAPDLTFRLSFDTDEPEPVTSEVEAVLYDELAAISLTRLPELLAAEDSKDLADAFAHYQSMLDAGVTSETRAAQYHEKLEELFARLPDARRWELEMAAWGVVAGYAKYSSDLDPAGNGYYHLHVDFMTAFPGEEGIKCWIRAMDRLALRFPLRLIEIG